MAETGVAPLAAEGDAAPGETSLDGAARRFWAADAGAPGDDAAVVAPPAGVPVTSSTCSGTVGRPVVSIAKAPLRRKLRFFFQYR